MENAQRKREILDVCLATFIRRGLYETSVRDLSRALALQSGGIYYWFKDKDDVVVTCAEEAALRLEEHLIAPALQDIREPDRMMERLRLRSDELRPMMKFFASVCACSRYEERLRPVLGRLAERYEKYAARFASELHCELQEIAPYVYFAITTVTDYMIFGEVSYMALEEGTDETRYVCRCCGKLLTVKNWKLLTQKERRPIPDDSEYVMLPPDTTVVLYSDVLPLTIPSTGEKLQIKKPMVTVGRASDSDVRLSARTVARRQAAFFYEQEIWFVRDNFSTNGTWINGRKLIPGKKYQLAAYDEIGFARTEKVIFDLRNESYTPPRQETPPRPMGDFAGEKRIGEYEVIRALAPLSVKDVYLAKSSRTDRLVVLKPCRKDDRPAQKAIRELLLKEADLLRQLDHPAIPKLVEVLEDEETLCVVREYFDGETLESVMAREGTQDLIQVVDWAWQLCDVLRYLHERNYVYRDMKPGNILLRPDGRLALIDFGTMRVYKPGKAGDTVCLGTRGYAAPEQFGGMGQTDARTDIYGLGATLYYLATGCNPGVPPYEIDCIHAMYIGGFPHQLGDLIQKCVQPDPVRRFQSCRELMEALEDASFDVTTNQEKLAQWKRILRREEQS